MHKISNYVYQISLGSVNAFIIEDKGLTLIDTGNKNSATKIYKAIEKGGKNPSDIKQIILTHCHPDHAGSASEIKNRFQVPVWAHHEDALLIEKGIGARMPMSLSPGIINWLIFNLFIKRAETAIESTKVDERLKDNDLLPILGGVQVIHTPGHCAGHIALLIKEEGLLIGADICSHLTGLGLCPVNEDIKLSLKSILKAASYNFDIALFGHGSPLKGSANNKIMKKFALLQSALKNKV